MVEFLPMATKKKWRPSAVANAHNADIYGAGRKVQTGHRFESYMIEWYDEFAEELAKLTGREESPADAIKVWGDYVLRAVALDGVSVKEVVEKSRRGLG